MYVAERLVFVELHKTGGTHIGKWLSQLAPGQQVGKHNRVPETLRDRFVVGAVRNPWDWYVSLWAYGCDGRGSVHRQTTTGIDVQYLLRQLGPELGVSGYPVLRMLRQAASDWGKPAASWRATYRDAADPSAFRAWLRLMMDPARRFDVAEGFGFSPVSQWAGLMTYRYLKLFSSLGNDLYADARLRTHRETVERWHRSRVVQFVIRNEFLEDDLLEALTRAGYALSDEQQSAVRAGRTQKTNTSSRRSASYYYDDESIALIREREALIIEEHGYVPPASAAT